jgi:hypothetical protein
MQILRNKTMAIMIALILTFSTSASMLLQPTVTAHTPTWQIATTAYVSAEPNPVGIGQQVSIVMLINWVMPGALIQNTIRPHGYQLTITKPDGTVQTSSYDPYDSGSSRFVQYTPDQLGNYTVKFVYPGEVYHFPGYNSTTASSAYLNDAYENDTFLGSSAETTFTVQQDPIAYLPSTPLPTEYWTRPIFGENHDWASVASNWLGGAATSAIVQENGLAPTSAHIMWTKSNRLGGIVGDVNSADPYQTFYSGFSYETVFGSPLIVGGILFYKNQLNHAGNQGDFRALDLRTGETVWSNPALNTMTAVTPTKAQLMDFQSPDQHGTPSGLLWAVSGTTWIGYDVFTGYWVCNLTGVPSGTEAYTPSGDIVRYVLNYNATKGSGWLALWNDTAAMTRAPASNLQYGPDYEIRINGQIIDASISTGVQNSYSWNVSIPTLPTDNQAPSIVGVIPGDIILGTSSNIALASLPRVPTLPWTMWAISDKPETRGQLLWSKTYSAAPNNYTIMLAWQPIDKINREWTMTYADTGERLGYSMVDGSLVFGPIGVPDSAIDGKALQYYSSREGQPAYGNLYVSGYGGQVLCYSMKNGSLLWTFNSINSGIDTPWGLYPIHVGGFANGIVYAFSGEHSPNTPFYKGYRMYALNATTGTELFNLPTWSASGLGTSVAPLAIADGYMAFQNGYTEQVYVLGKGPSAMTVTAPDTASPLGTSITIKGSITDISAGTKQAEQVARFPNGVPVASDTSQSDWMSYVYQQQPMPTNFVGVPVTISVVDSNGNYREIGKTNSNSDGFFSLNWKPDITGQYTVYASFTGSESYYPSHAVTAFSVDPLAPTVAPTNIQPQFDSVTQSLQNTIIIAAVAIIIAIAIVGILTLRKK